MESVTALNETGAKEGYQMALSNKDKGLCSTCFYAEDCIHCRKSLVPILFCEEFCTEPVSRTGLREASSVSSLKTAATANEKEKQSEDLQGLCITCEHRKTCTFPKVAGGVWHCEEYC